jgi:hypothetical protein
MISFEHNGVDTNRSRVNDVYLSTHNIYPSRALALILASQFDVFNFGSLNRGTSPKSACPFDYAKGHTVPAKIRHNPSTLGCNDGLRVQQCSFSSLGSSPSLAPDKN